MLIPTMLVIAAMSTQPKITPIQTELECLTQNIAHEAPEESYEGKLAVATVTMNRVQNKSFPNTVCGVVYQRGQFSWTALQRKPVFAPSIYASARQIAEEVLYQKKRLISIGNALFFHNTSVTPSWSLSMRLVRQIGGHRFYATS
jgi:N-acetylmuramoyl-L-alanine amidase